MALRKLTKRSTKPLKTDENEINPVTEKKPLQISAKKTVLVLLVVLLLSLGFIFKHWFVVAIVNNKPITRYSLDRDLEKQGGKQVLENKIAEILVSEEAKKQKVTVSSQEIDQKIKDIEKQIEAQGQKLDDFLASQGLTRKDIEKQLVFRVTIEKLLAKEIEISDKEIADYFEKNKSFYPKDTKIEDRKEEIRNGLLQQKLGDKVPVWLEDLKKNSKIYYFLKF